MKPLTLHAEIEILASPAVVRSKILIQDPDKQPKDLQKGDKLSVSMASFSFKPTVVENTPEVFIWDGALPYAFTGRHYFKFEPSNTNPGGTTFVQHEDFFGPLVTLFFWYWSGKEMSPSPGWLDFNKSLKEAAEAESSL